MVLVFSPTPPAPSSVTSPLPDVASSTVPYIQPAQISHSSVSISSRPSPPIAPWQSSSSTPFSSNLPPPSLSVFDFPPICASRQSAPKSRAPFTLSALSSHVGTALPDSPPPPIFQSNFTKSVVDLGPCPPSSPPSGHLTAPFITHSVSMDSPGCVALLKITDSIPVDGVSVGGSICSPSRIGEPDCRDHFCCSAGLPISSNDPPSGLLNKLAAPEPKPRLGPLVCTGLPGPYFQPIPVSHQEAKSEPSQNSVSMVNSPDFASSGGSLDPQQASGLFQQPMLPP